MITYTILVCLTGMCLAWALLRVPAINKWAYLRGPAGLMINLIAGLIIAALTGGFAIQLATSGAVAPRPPPTPTPPLTTSPIPSGQGPPSATATPGAGDTLSSCLSAVFKDIPSERVVQLKPTNDGIQLGPTVNNHDSLAGHYGVELMDLTNRFIGAIHLTYSPAAHQYKLEQIVDSTCQPTMASGLPSPVAAANTSVDLRFGDRTIRLQIFDRDGGDLYVRASTG